MKFDNSKKFDLYYYGQVNSLWLKLGARIEWASVCTISKLHSILPLANSLAHNNISQICYCG